METNWHMLRVRLSYPGGGVTDCTGYICCCCLDGIHLLGIYCTVFVEYCNWHLWDLQSVWNVLQAGLGKDGGGGWYDSDALRTQPGILAPTVEVCRAKRCARSDSGCTRPRVLSVQRSGAIHRAISGQASCAASQQGAGLSWDKRDCFLLFLVHRILNEMVQHM